MTTGNIPRRCPLGENIHQRRARRWQTRKRDWVLSNFFRDFREKNSGSRRIPGDPMRNLFVTNKCLALAKYRERYSCADARLSNLDVPEFSFEIPGGLWIPHVRELADPGISESCTRKREILILKSLDCGVFKVAFNNKRKSLSFL